MRRRKDQKVLSSFNAYILIIIYKHFQDFQNVLESFAKSKATIRENQLLM